MSRIRDIAAAILSLDTRSLEFSVGLMNFIWGWWLFLVDNQLANSQGDRLLTALSSYGGKELWGLVFMVLFALGVLLAYRSVVHHETIFWTIRSYVLSASFVLWTAYSIVFMTVSGLFSIPAFIFAGVGLVALFGSILLRWDYK